MYFSSFFDPLYKIWTQQIFKFIRLYHPQTFFILISASYAKFEQIPNFTSYIFAQRFNFFTRNEHQSLPAHREALASLLCSALSKLEKALCWKLFLYFSSFFDLLHKIWTQQIFKIMTSYHLQTFFILISASYAKFEQILSLSPHIFAQRFDFFDAKIYQKNPAHLPANERAE